jgi:hypothetical protein
MSDFSLTTLFVVPVGQTTVPSTGSTQDLTAGLVGVYLNDYTAATVGNIAAAPYFYVAQGRTNTYLQGSKRSDKITGCLNTGSCNSNIVEWYKVGGCATPAVQITDVTGFTATCGDILTLTLRAHSSYLDTLYFNGFTRSVTVQAPCCDCGADPCTTVDVSALIDQFIVKLNAVALDFNGGATTGTNPDNIHLSQFFTFENIGGTTLRISGKALTRYAQPCDVSAFPFEYDRMWFRTFVYSGPATTADFIVSDACNIVATAAVVQRSTYATGLADEIKQLEKNFYSYQAGYLKHLYKLAGYNGNFESWVTDGQVYDTYYIKFTDPDVSAKTWGDYILEDETVIIACVAGGAYGIAIEAILEAALGAVASDNTCITTTTTTTAATTSTTSSTTTLIP